jgi:hypothetical protein
MTRGTKLVVKAIINAFVITDNFPIASRILYQMPILLTLGNGRQTISITENIFEKGSKPLSDGSFKTCDNLFCIESDLKKVVNESEERRQREGRHKNRHKTKL